MSFVAVGVGVAAAGVGVYSAIESGKSAKKQAKNAIAANAVNAGAMGAERTDQQSKISANYAAYVAALNASASDRGQMDSGSTKALQLAALVNSQYDSANVDITTEYEKAGADYRTMSQVNAARASAQNPALAAFSGGLTGLSAGFAIRNGFMGPVTK